VRFLFVSNFYPPYDIGGYEKHCREVTEGLRQRGHTVQVLTSRHGVIGPVQDGYIRRSLFLESNLRHYSPVRFLTRRGHEEHYNIRILRSVLADTAPDAIVFWGMWNLSRRLPAVAESASVPVAYWLGDFWPIEPDVHTRYWRSPAQGRVGHLLMSWAAPWALRRLSAKGYPPALQFRHVACGSQFLKRKLAAEIPAFQDAEIVLCGTDLGVFADCQPHPRLFDPAAPRIIYVGGLGPHKGVHTAVEALSRLMGQAPTIQPMLTIVGSGHPDYTARLRRLADDNGTAAHIHFTGSVAPEKVLLLLAESDILVVPSVWDEPFGRVIVEGMAAGLAVVGTATGGSAEILKDGANGLVFPVGDAGTLADCLLRLIDDPALYGRLAREGKKTSERFDLRQMVDGMERFLLQVVASGRQRVNT
jgi:glycogen(starch) synthase